MNYKEILYSLNKDFVIKESIKDGILNIDIEEKNGDGIYRYFYTTESKIDELFIDIRYKYILDHIFNKFCQFYIIENNKMRNKYKKEEGI